MTHYAISKFKDRNELNWTSVSDINRKFGGRTFLKVEYCKIEDLYVKFILDLIDNLNCKKIILDMLEKYPPYEKQYMFDISLEPSILREKEIISKTKLASVLKLSLRELIWTRIQLVDIGYITFGHDYYMHFGINDGISTAFLNGIIPKMLFLEERQYDPLQ